MYKNYKKPDKLAIKTKLTWEESQHVFTLDPEKTCLSDSWITLKVVLVLSIYNESTNNASCKPCGEAENLASQVEGHLIPPRLHL